MKKINIDNLLKIKLLSILLAVSTLFSSCELSFDDKGLVVDQAEAKHLLGESIIESIEFFEEIEWDGAFVQSHYLTVGGNGITTLSRQNLNTNLWQRGFTLSVKPAQDIINLYENETGHENRVNVAKIWKSYLYSVIVSMYGPVPYFQAMNGEIYVPFNSEQEIYTDLLLTLKNASNEISQNLGGDTYTAETDFMFNGDLNKWVKFSNSLRLRIAVQLYGVSSKMTQELRTEVQTTMDELLNNPELMIASVDENVSFKHLDSELNANAFSQVVLRSGGNQSGNINPSETLMGYIMAHNDPRKTYYADASPNNGGYFGRPVNKNNTPIDDENYPNNPHSTDHFDYAQIGTRWLNPTSPFRIFHYDEVCFLIAEAYLLKGDMSNASTFYQEGITAAMEKLGISSGAIDAYLAEDGIALNTETFLLNADTYKNWLGAMTPKISTDIYQKIVVQRWLASYPQSFDVPPFLKRTEFVKMSKPLIYRPAATNPYLENAPMPTRWVYPDFENATNNRGYAEGVSLLGGENGMYTKLFYDPN